jgi:hypothetical protein
VGQATQVLVGLGQRKRAADKADRSMVGEAAGVLPAAIGKWDSAVAAEVDAAKRDLAATTFVLALYSSPEHGLPMAMVGTLLLVSRISDAITDPTHDQTLACLNSHQSQLSDTALAALSTWSGFRGLQQAR